MKIFMGPLKLHTAQELNIFLEKSTDVIIGYFWKKFGGQLEVHNILLEECSKITYNGMDF